MTPHGRDAGSWLTTQAREVAEKAGKAGPWPWPMNLTAETIIRNISGLKEGSRETADHSLRSPGAETARYEAVKRAIVEKEAELAEIYEIQKAASSLAAS